MELSLLQRMGYVTFNRLGHRAKQSQLGPERRAGSSLGAMVRNKANLPLAGREDHPQGRRP
jgi:hypothetical protein